MNYPEINFKAQSTHELVQVAWCIEDSFLLKMRWENFEKERVNYLWTVDFGAGEEHRN